MSELEATVVVLTFNGEKYLERILRGIAEQQFDGARETIVIDSGSTDGTLEIVAGHPDVRLVQIPNAEFGHGKTRDLAVRLARGRYVAFLTQDAVPSDDQWLTELLAPFAIDERVAIVTGRQVPRDSAFPAQKYDITHTFSAIGSSAGTVLFDGARPGGTKQEAAIAAFHSDVNAAVRRDLATTLIPFRDVPYSEDQLMGREVLDAALWKAYAGRAVVEHSNDLTLREYGKRLFDETVALRRLGHDYSATTLARMVIAITFGTLGDAVKILRDHDYRMSQKLRWWIVNPAFVVQRWVSTYRAAHFDLSDRSLIRSRSLEHERKRKRERTPAQLVQREVTEPDASN